MPETTESTNNGSRDYCRTLAVDSAPSDPTMVERAWNRLRKDMALVPEGEVALTATDPESLTHVTSLPCVQVSWVDSFYMDRFCVTNDDFADFVRSGGYTQENLWPPEILAEVLQFVDSTGLPGPRFWENGKPTRSQRKLPVTGVCWYEANAYAHWVGKRLPTPAEWQWAAIWAGGRGQSGSQRKYPWGDSFDPTRCNTWNSHTGTPVPVDEHYSGCTPNGIYQMIGNVWEWTGQLFECDDSSKGDRVLTESPLAEIRGGAFDTYFASQTTAQFRTGQKLLYRGPNQGFRCCVSGDQLVSSSDPYSFLDDEAEA